MVSSKKVEVAKTNKQLQNQRVNVMLGGLSKSKPRQATEGSYTQEYNSPTTIPERLYNPCSSSGQLASYTVAHLETVAAPLNGH